MVHLVCWLFFVAAMPRRCVRMSKEQSQFRTWTKSHYGEKVSVTSDSDPTEHCGENSAIIIVQAHFDEPDCSM